MSVRLISNSDAKRVAIAAVARSRVYGYRDIGGAISAIRMRSVSATRRARCTLACRSDYFNAVAMQVRYTPL